MGIKSTTTLTRERAESLLVEKVLDSNRRTIEGLVRALSNKEIEDRLEVGETFTNYSIEGDD